MKNGIHAQGDHHRDTVANCDIGVTPRAMATSHADTVPTAQSNSSHADAQALAVALQERVYGEVRFDDGSRALYATDGSNYRQTPIGVVIPRDLNDEDLTPLAISSTSSQNLPLQIRVLAKT